MDLELLIQRLFSAETDEARAEILAEIEDPAATAVEARTMGAGLLAGDDPDLDVIAALADTGEMLDTEVSRREALTAERETELAALRERLGADAPADDDGEAASAEGDALSTDDGGEGSDGDGVGDGVGDSADAEGEGEGTGDGAPTSTARRVPNLAAIREFVPAERTPIEDTSTATQPPRVRALAGPDLPSFPSGQHIPNVEQIAEAMIERRETLGNSSGGDKVRVVRMDYSDAIATKATDDPTLNGRLMRQAGTPNALTASGGFCAPGETVYNFVKLNRPTNLVQNFLPTMGAPRGAVSFPTSPDIRDAFATPTSHTYTEANDIASTPKTTVVIPCPDWAECTVEAQYDILQFGNFATRALPEWVTHWTGLSMDAHEHLVSAKLATRIVSLSNAAVTVAATGGATATLLSYAALASADYRQDLRMDEAAPIEMMAPAWIYSAIRADLIKSGAVSSLGALSVTRADIDSWFSASNVTVRPVTDWQAQIGGGVNAGASAFPASIQVVFFAPGTFVRLDMGTLDLGLVRDSTLNSTNDYNIFVESFEQVCMPGLESRNYTLELCVNGAFSSLEDLICAGTSHGTS